MARDHRMLDDDGNSIDFTCENSRFKTDITRHAPGARPGSVLPGPLYPTDSNEQYSLWLEHVVEKATDKHVFWLMWYKDGKPTMPMSSVMSKDDVKKIIDKLTMVNDQLLDGENT